MSHLSLHNGAQGLLNVFLLGPGDARMLGWGVVHEDQPQDVPVGDAEEG